MKSKGLEVEDVLGKAVLELNKKNLDNLKKIVETNNYTFCLGAGVSIAAGLPGWYKLLSKMMGRLLFLDSEIDKTEDVSAFFQAKNQITEQQYTNSNFLKKMNDAYNGCYSEMFDGEDTLELAEAIYHYVYYESGIGYSDEKAGKDEQKLLADFQVKRLVRDICLCEETPQFEGTVLEAIASVLKRQEAKKKEIITYNYDNLLEEALRVTTNISSEEMISYSGGDIFDADEKKTYHIYHIHGCVPVIEGRGEKESDRIILTEHSYGDIEREGYGWVNTIQSYKYHTSNMIFVGFSGQDYNFRRILRNLKPVKKDSNQHYIFICIDDIVNKIFKEVPLEERKEVLKDPDKLKEEYAFELLLLNQLLGQKYVYWSEYGLIPIWTTFLELAGMIKELL